MKKLFFVIALLSASFAYTQPAQHVVVITVDGFRPDFYLDPGWNTPTIRSLLKEGAHANGVTSVFPSMTYPSHTTIVTGVQPAQHGVYSNGMFEPMGSTGKMYWNNSSIKVPTLWKAVQDKGLKATALFWPVSADAPVSYNIPDIGSMGEGVREKYSRPAGFLDTVKAQVFDGAAKIQYGKDQNVARIAAYVIKKDQPNLMTIHLFSVDHFEHMQGRQGDSVKAAVADADSAVAIIIDALKEAGIWNSTTLIVTGDHGFVNVTATVSPNVWLARAGLIKDVKTDDWKAQFYSFGGGAYLYLKDKNDQATLKQVNRILDEVPAEQKKFFRVISRKQLDAVGGNPEVPLALSGENGASFNGALEGEPVKPGKGGSHGYFPDFHDIQTGFVAYGAGIRPGTVIPTMSVRDIAPTVARLLGLDFPSAAGKIPDNLLKK
ncbi:MAG: alkaline phosphatase family protein [Williamsia sp.]|nr:alkaline phosphatase family protein [Williamsia sp.]